MSVEVESSTESLRDETIPANTTDSQTSADEAGPEGEPVGSRFLFFQVVPSWLTSFIIHMVLIIALALYLVPTRKRTVVSLYSTEPSQDIVDVEDISFDSLDYSNDLNENTEFEETNQEELADSLETIEMDDTFDSTMSSLFEDLSETSSIDADANADEGFFAAAENQISGRSGVTKTQMLRQSGGTQASENAVRLALEWLKAHQIPASPNNPLSGSWNFDHRAGPGSHRTSPNAGDFSRAQNAATAMALLCFLGNGQTHLQGDYKEVVENGLAFLLRNGRLTRGGLSFYEGQGGMYNHGLAAITLCEAYAMTDDVRLASPAQAALRFIEYAQDPIGGGWRYEPKTPGDTSAVGWQIMALKSANMSGLDVNKKTIRGANKFLNYVALDSGSYYGYMQPGRIRKRGTTSVGLLCRMYLGWTRDNPALVNGVEWMSDLGPSVGVWKPGMREISENDKPGFDCNMYYNYYATQVMRQYGGETWTKWNTTMRDFLIATQSTEGPSKGSWYFSKPDLGYPHGGRLYATTLAAMTLEVYYRYLPLYDNEQTSEDEFELD